VQVTIGSRLGSHEIVSRLGAGGMGEVFLATDTKLKRRVAIKVLPAAAAHDAERLARFHREAHAVAALNHPNIAAIYDLEESDGIRYLVLELVEGDTLADRLRQGPLSIDDSLTIARQILEALEVAHEKGICHRDLKPANIKVTPDGVVKVLDFGIAKFLNRSGHGDAGTTIDHTSPGVVIGTPGYMSPEQAKGLGADERSDIFSCGCIFYELLTGRRAFDGDTTSEAMASILKSDVDFSRLPQSLHPRLREILARCLQKDPRQRWHAAADVRLQIESVADTGDAAPPLPRAKWTRRAAVAAAAVIATITGGYAAWTLKPSPPRAVTRFWVTLPEGQQFSHVGRPVLAISRDGKNMVYVANRRLYLRPMAGFESSVIPGSELPDGVQGPVFSPDGQWIAFRSVGDATLKRLPISGGTPVTIGPNPTPFGLSWSDQGLLFGQLGTGIMRVAAEGGAPEVIVPVPPEETADSPQLLPGGNVMFSVKKVDDDWDQGQIAVQSMTGGPRKIILNGGAAAVYLPTGHLIYAVANTLFAVPFDAERLTVTGGAVSIVEGVNRGFQNRSARGAAATAQYAVSNSGSLVFIPGTRGSLTDGRVDLALFNRTSAPHPLGLPPAAYGAPRVSHDGKWAAVERAAGADNDVWIVDLTGSAPIRRLTFGGRSRAPIWSSDSSFVIFQSEQGDASGLFRQRADGSGTPERLTTAATGVAHVPQSASPDGAHVLFTVLEKERHSLWDLSMRDRRLSPFGGVTAGLLVEAAFSPDGHWVTYSIMERAEGLGPSMTESLVQPFPATGAKYQIPSAVGATRPVWTRSGDSIVVGLGIGRDAILPVVTSPRFEFGKPDPFAHGARQGGAPAGRRNFDPVPDGRLLGLISPALDQSGGAPVPQVAVVLDWFEELRARVR
jgi:serine/threonine-protein kinase